MANIDIKELTNPATPIEHRQKVMRGLIAQIPAIGSIITEYLPDARIKKMVRFVVQLSEDLEKLKSKLDDEYIQRDDVLCLVEKSFKSLYETYDTNKLMALKNGLIRVIVDKNIEVDRKDFYINLLNSLTPFHFRILSLIYSTEEYLKENNIKLSENVSSGRIFFFKEAIRDMNETEIIMVYQELVSKMLVQNVNLSAGSSQNGIYALKGLDTNFGREFMSFFKNNF